MGVVGGDLRALLQQPNGLAMCGRVWVVEVWVDGETEHLLMALLV